MPNLRTTVRWERYAPDLPGNRANKPPFYFEIAADLTKEQFISVQRDLEAVDEFPEPPKDETEEQALARVKLEDDERVKRSAKALAPYVKMGVEPLTIDDVPIKSLEDYFAAVSKFQSKFFYREPASILGQLNNLGGDGGFFSARLSGGRSSTRAPNGA